MLSKIEIQFILAASLVGIVYALTIVLISKEAGTQTAALVGVGLTAAAASLCGRYNTLSVHAGSGVDGDSLRQGIPLVLLLAIVLVGMQVVLGSIHGLMRSVFPAIPAVAGPSTNVAFLISMIIVAYLLGGFVAAGALPQMRLSVWAWAAFLSYLINFLLGIVPMLIGHGWRQTFKALSLLQSICFIYVAAAVFPFMIRRYAQRHKTPVH